MGKTDHAKRMVEALTPDGVGTGFAIMDGLAGQGIVTSVAYGPCGDKGNQWTVMLCTIEGEEFDTPIMAVSFQHAMGIALWEAISRGWADAAELGRSAEALGKQIESGEFDG